MEFITQNGNKKVELKEASFKDASDLKKSAMQCLLKTDALKNLDLNNLQDVDLAKIFDSLFQLILNMDISAEFESAVFKCLSSCIYDGFYKIDDKLFDDKPEIREDYYEIVSKCVELNLRPFFKSLVSELKQRFQTITNNENQESK